MADFRTALAHLRCLSTDFFGELLGFLEVEGLVNTVGDATSALGCRAFWDAGDDTSRPNSEADEPSESTNDLHANCHEKRENSWGAREYGLLVGSMSLLAQLPAPRRNVDILRRRFAELANGVPATFYAALITELAAWGGVEGADGVPADGSARAGEPGPVEKNLAEENHMIESDRSFEVCRLYERHVLNFAELLSQILPSNAANACIIEQFCRGVARSLRDLFAEAEGSTITHLSQFAERLVRRGGFLKEAFLEDLLCAEYNGGKTGFLCRFLCALQPSPVASSSSAGIVARASSSRSSGGVAETVLANLGAKHFRRLMRAELVEPADDTAVDDSSSPATCSAALTVRQGGRSSFSLEHEKRLPREVSSALQAQLQLPLLLRMEPARLLAALDWSLAVSPLEQAEAHWSALWSREQPGGRSGFGHQLSTRAELVVALALSRILCLRFLVHRKQVAMLEAYMGQSDENRDADEIPCVAKHGGTSGPEKKPAPLNQKSDGPRTLEEAQRAADAVEFDPERPELGVEELDPKLMMAANSRLGRSEGQRPGCSSLLDSETTRKVLAGVSQRLEEVCPERRRFAMFVAETLAFFTLPQDEPAAPTDQKRPEAAVENDDDEWKVVDADKLRPGEKNMRFPELDYTTDVGLVFLRSRDVRDWEPSTSSADANHHVERAESTEDVVDPEGKQEPAIVVDEDGAECYVGGFGVGNTPAKKPSPAQQPPTATKRTTKLPAHYFAEDSDDATSSEEEGFSSSSSDDGVFEKVRSSEEEGRKKQKKKPPTQIASNSVNNPRFLPNRTFFDLEKASETRVVQKSAFFTTLYECYEVLDHLDEQEPENQDEVLENVLQSIPRIILEGDVYAKRHAAKQRALQRAHSPSRRHVLEDGCGVTAYRSIHSSSGVSTAGIEDNVEYRRTEIAPEKAASSISSDASTTKKGLAGDDDANASSSKRTALSRRRAERREEFRPHQAAAESVIEELAFDQHTVEALTERLLNVDMEAFGTERVVQMRERCLTLLPDNTPILWAFLGAGDRPFSDRIAVLQVLSLKAEFLTGGQALMRGNATFQKLEVSTDKKKIGNCTESSNARQCGKLVRSNPRALAVARSEKELQQQPNKNTPQENAFAHAFWPEFVSPLLAQAATSFGAPLVLVNLLQTLGRFFRNAGVSVPRSDFDLAAQETWTLVQATLVHRDAMVRRGAWFVLSQLLQSCRKFAGAFQVPVEVFFDIAENGEALGGILVDESDEMCKTMAQGVLMYLQKLCEGED